MKNEGSFFGIMPRKKVSKTEKFFLLFSDGMV